MNMGGVRIKLIIKVRMDGPVDEVCKAYREQFK